MVRASTQAGKAVTPSGSRAAAGAGRFLVPAFVLSLLGHGVLAAVLLRGEPRQPTLKPIVSVEMVSAMPGAISSRQKNGRNASRATPARPSKNNTALQKSRPPEKQKSTKKTPETKTAEKAQKPMTARDEVAPPLWKPQPGPEKQAAKKTAKPAPVQARKQAKSALRKPVETRAVEEFKISVDRRFSSTKAPAATSRTVQKLTIRQTALAIPKPATPETVPEARMPSRDGIEKFKWFKDRPGSKKTVPRPKPKSRWPDVKLPERDGAIEYRRFKEKPRPRMAPANTTAKTGHKQAQPVKAKVRVRKKKQVALLPPVKAVKKPPLRKLQRTARTKTKAAARPQARRQRAARREKNAGAQRASLNSQRSVARSGAYAPPRAGRPGGVNPIPHYPHKARRKGWQGRVLLTVRVNANGRAIAVNIRKSSGHSTLDQAALRAVRRWRFESARREATAVAGITIVPITFRLTP